MAIEFTRLADVTAIEEVKDEDTVLVVQDGEVKRAPKTAVGGGGEWDAVIDLGEDTLDENFCALWDGHYGNAKFISGDYNAIMNKFNAGELPNILLYGVANVYDTLYTFKTKASNITVCDTELSINYEACNLCGYYYSATIIVDSTNNFVDNQYTTM